MSKILIIEDQAPMRRNIALMLELEGFEVLVAENGRKGLELAKTAVPDLILCDVMMPEMDGHGVVQLLRADPRTATVPLIFLTARTYPACWPQCMPGWRGPRPSRSGSRPQRSAAVHRLISARPIR
jgi:CheY-like chemotaxis protein